MMFDNIALLVKAANPDREAGSLNRRALKLLEELGEVAQAYLSVTSSSNLKSKTWDDVREEIADCLIVALDIAWTALPWETEATTATVAVVPIDDFYLAINRVSYQLAFYASSLDLPFGLARHAITKLVSLVWQIATTPLDDQIYFASDHISEQLKLEVERKLRKWDANRLAMAVSTDDV